ncbi:DUF3127 domain-containing protein [bacterium]|nr:DUF3127 domain-containing protein [bacterium]
MAYEMTGTVTKIAERKQISEKFAVQDFILHIPDEKYPQDIRFQASNKALEYLKPDLIGQSAKITFDIRGRGVPQKGYFNTLAAWKIEALQQRVPEQVAQVFPDATVEDDLPF